MSSPIWTGLLSYCTLLLGRTVFSDLRDTCKAVIYQAIVSYKRNNHNGTESCVFIELQGNKSTSLQIKADIFLFLKGSHVEEYRPAYRGDTHTHRERKRDNECLLIHWHKFPNSLVDFTAGYRIAHTHTAAASACWEEQSASKATVQYDKAACAFKFHDPLFTAGAGWLAGSACARCLE